VQAHPSGGSSEGHEAVLDDESSSSTDSDPFVQNLFVLRHGEAGGGDDGEGVSWDPPLTNRGKLQAWRVGRNLRMEDWNITRVVMSPFLRCVQTAAEVIAGLCLLPSSLEQGVSTNAASGSVPALRASIEFGLAKVMERQGISRPPQAHKSSLEPWTLDLPELYSLLPSEIYDTSYQPIRQTLPSSRESAADMQSRYTTTLQKIANKFHSEHILCITHGEGVMNAVSMMWPRVEIYGAMHCAHIHAQRPNFNSEDGPNIHSGEWELLTESSPSSGIFYAPSP